jgi:phosphatidylglycerol---prolipoprotein diacylglyceryl transferase
LHPELFRLHLGGFERPFYTYGALVVCGMALAVAVAVARARRYGVAPFDELAIGLLAIAGGVLGGALLYICVHVRDVARDPAILLAPGLVFYGGVLGAPLPAWLYARRFGVPLARALDAGVPGVALGHALGRIGCLMGGCCYGRACAPGAPLAVWLHGAWRHPVQAYEAAGLVALAGVLFALSSPLRARPGALAALYLAAYAILRFAMETLRADDAERGFVGALSTSQVLAALALVVAIALYVTRPRVSQEAR